MRKQSHDMKQGIYLWSKEPQQRLLKIQTGLNSLK